MATVPDKSGNSPIGVTVEVHVIPPEDLVKTGITAKTRPGSPSSNPAYVPVP